MAHIRFRNGAFNGSVGPVQFRDGEADTDVPAMLAHFARNPERYEVTEGGAPDPDPEGGPEGPEGEQEPDGDPQDPEPDPEAPADPKPEDPEGDPEPATPATPADPYDVSVAELRKLAGARKLPQAGSRAELQERIRAYDAEHADDTQE